MSWTDKEIADMAKAAQSEQKFAYQDAYFEEMATLLPKKKKRAFPFFILPLIPMLGMIGYFGTLKTNVSEKLTKRNDKQMTQTRIAEENNKNTTNHYNKFNPNKDVPSSDKTGLRNKVHQENKSILKENNSSNLISNSEVKKMKPNPSITGVSKAEPFVGKEQGVGYVNSKPAQEVGFTAKFVGRETGFKTNEVNNPSSEDILDIDTDLELFPNRAIGSLNLLPLSFFMVSNDQKITAMLPFKPAPTWRMYVEAGFGMGESYLTTQVGHTVAGNLGAGVRYDTRHTFVQFGLAGEMQKIRMELNEREKIYHTSVTEFENRFNYKNLYRVQLPMTVGVQLKKHSLQASFIPTYLLSSKMDYSYIENGDMMRSETMFGQRKGWNDFSTNVGFGYGFELFKSVTIGVNVNWQLMTQLNKNEVNEGVNRPFSGQVFLRKTIK